jgi:hypothetical protein
MFIGNVLIFFTNTTRMNVIKKKQKEKFRKVKPQSPIKTMFSVNYVVFISAEKHLFSLSGFSLNDFWFSNN